MSRSRGSRTSSAFATVGLGVLGVGYVAYAWWEAAGVALTARRPRALAALIFAGCGFVLGCATRRSSSAGT